MKIALCLSGNMRSYQSVAKSLIDNIIAPNACDVFISTWDVIGHAKHHLTETENFQQPLDVSDVTSRYAPYLREIIVHNFNDIQKVLPKAFYQGMVSMYWQIQQANQLRKMYQARHAITYDLIIRARPDFYFNNGFQLGNGDWYKNKLWLQHYDQLLCSDVFAFAEPEIMDWYSDLFNYIEQYNQEEYPEHPTMKQVIWSEQTLLKHIKRKGIEIGTIPIDCVVERAGIKYE